MEFSTDVYNNFMLLELEAEVEEERQRREREATEKKNAMTLGKKWANPIYFTFNTFFPVLLPPYSILVLDALTSVLCCPPYTYID